MTTTTVEVASREADAVRSQDFVYCGRRVLASGKLAIAVCPIKAEHHIITTAAALANWHLAMFGNTDMCPGIDGEAALSVATADMAAYDGKR